MTKFKTFRKLYKAFGHHKPIPTNDTHGMFPVRRVVLIPTDSIYRTENRYSLYRNKVRAEQETANVNQIRRAIRKGEKLPPIEVYVRNRPKHPQYSYGLIDGHHRLTAHQAEGKRFIRAVIHYD